MILQVVDKPKKQTGRNGILVWKTVGKMGKKRHGGEDLVEKTMGFLFGFAGASELFGGMEKLVGATFYGYFVIPNI